MKRLIAISIVSLTIMACGTGNSVSRSTVTSTANTAKNCVIDNNTGACKELRSTAETMIIDNHIIKLPQYK